MLSTFKSNMKVDFRTYTNYILKSNMKVDFRTYNLVHIFKNNMKLIFRTYKVPHSQVQYERWF